MPTSIFYHNMVRYVCVCTLYGSILSNKLLDLAFNGPIFLLPRELAKRKTKMMSEGLCLVYVCIDDGMVWKPIHIHNGLNSAFQPEYHCDDLLHLSSVDDEA